MLLLFSQLLSTWAFFHCGSFIVVGTIGPEVVGTGIGKGQHNALGTMGHSTIIVVLVGVNKPDDVVLSSGAMCESAYW